VMSGRFSRFVPESFKRLIELGVATLVGVGWYFSFPIAEASGNRVHPPHYYWRHEASLFNSYDHAAIRRGFMVYDQIAKPCHSMKGNCYRHLTNVAFTEEEVKTIAASNDGYFTAPDDDGEIHERTGLPTDRFKSPYSNEQEARAANGGALPPDLTYIVKAREGNENYLFSLLTGYRDPPHGVVLGENMYYNIYFLGGQLAMPPPLAAGAVDYGDGTEASICQMAKDVSVFLSWSASKEHDERHLMGLKYVACSVPLVGMMYPLKSTIESIRKRRRVSFFRSKKDNTH